MSAMDYACPRCGAAAGQPCVSLGSSRAPAGATTRRPHEARSALVPRPIPECGTYSGYQAHWRRGEPPCAPCREASRVYHARYRSVPEVAAKIRAENNARTRALWRLADLHRDEFGALVQEEMSR